MEVHVIQPQLNEAIFGAKTRAHLLHQTVVMQLANRRAGSASTKSKGFVRGGGKKPWRQKGTGRARAAALAAIWVRRRADFGPQRADYSTLAATARARRCSRCEYQERDGRLSSLDKVGRSSQTKLMVKVWPSESRGASS